LLDGGQFQVAVPLTRQLFEIREKVLGRNDFDTISSLGDLGQALSVAGDCKAAEPYFQEALNRFRRIGLADRRESLICMKEVAFSRLLEGDPAEADKLLSDAIPRAARVLGTNSLITLQLQRVRARALAEEGWLDQAEALAEAVLAVRLSQTSDRRGTGYTQLYLGQILVARDKLNEAEPHLKEALTIFREDFPKKPELAAQAANWLGAIYVARKDYSNAEPLLLLGPDQFFLPAAEMSPNERRLAIGHVVKFYEDSNRPNEAATWQKKLDGLKKL